MVVEAGRTGRRTGRTAQRQPLRWIASLSCAALALTATAGGLGAFCFARIIFSSTGQAAAVTVIGLAGVGGVAAFVGRQAYAALVGRLYILQQALDAAPEAQLIVGPDGRAAYANICFGRLFPGSGELPLDRIGQTVAADPASSTEFRRMRGRAAAGMQAAATLALQDVRSGALIRVEVSANPIAGCPGYSFWNVRDITAQHEIETVIRDERNKFADFLENAPVGFYSVDGSGRFRFVNQTLARWLGGTPADIIAQGVQLHGFLASPPPAGRPASDPFDRQEDRVARRGEVMLKTRQGRILPAWIGESVVGSGAELRTCSVVCDLTPEREWKAALRSSERFRRCFADAPVGIALLDNLGRFEEVNRVVGELVGVSPEELRGQELRSLLNEEDRDSISAKLQAAADGRADRDPVEVRLRRPSDKTMVLFLGRLDAAAGTPAPGFEPAGGLTLHFIDVTDRKNLEVQFAQSQKMQAVGQLAGGVAHDFNNLLTAMIGFCDLLLLRSPPGDPSFVDIMQIKQNANRAANLVRQLLAFSRQQTLQPRIINITDVLVELSHLLRRLIGENIELQVVHGSELGLVKVDQGQLEQVIINLAVNARDAMPGGGTLTIRTANVLQGDAMRRGHEVMPAGDYVRIEVADTGIGIPKDNLARIFDPFFSTKEVGSGTGLGLSTVYGIVKQTGGFVFADSPPGRGAIFDIYLPRHQPAEGAPAAPVDMVEPVPLKDLTGTGTVMLVEDEDPVRIFAARALRNKGYKVIEAKSGEAALDLIRTATENIDLLITDVVMPRMDGPGLVREVREIHPEMKVIFISGYAEDAFRQRLDSDSAIDFLSKPFTLQQLATKVKDVTGGGTA